MSKRRTDRPQPAPHERQDPQPTRRIPEQIGRQGASTAYGRCRPRRRRGCRGSDYVPVGHSSLASIDRCLNITIRGKRTRPCRLVRLSTWACPVTSAWCFTAPHRAPLLDYSAFHRAGARRRAHLRCGRDGYLLARRPSSDDCWAESGYSSAYRNWRSVRQGLVDRHTRPSNRSCAGSWRILRPGRRPHLSIRRQRESVKSIRSTLESAVIGTWASLIGLWVSGEDPSQLATVPSPAGGFAAIALRQVQEPGQPVRQALTFFNGGGTVLNESELPSSATPLVFSC